MLTRLCATSYVYKTKQELRSLYQCHQSFKMGLFPGEDVNTWNFEALSTPVPSVACNFARDWALLLSQEVPANLGNLPRHVSNYSFSFTNCKSVAVKFISGLRIHCQQLSFRWSPYRLEDMMTGTLLSILKDLAISARWERLDCC